MEQRDCAPGHTACTKPCKHPAHVTQNASWRLCWDCLLSFLPREIRPDGSTPSLHCRGDPGTPKLLAASGRAHLQPPLSPPEKQSSLVAKFRFFTKASQPGALRQVGGAASSPCPRRRVSPSPGLPELRALIVRLQAFSLRGAGGEPDSSGSVRRGGWSPGGKWRWRVAPRWVSGL